VGWAGGCGQGRASGGPAVGTARAASDRGATASEAPCGGQRQRAGTAKAALALADWNVLITNVPAALLSLEEAMVVMRLRWQIELLFKLWKSHGHLDEWRTANPARILCEVYAKLLALVLQQWMIVASGWGDPERRLFKAAQVVRSSAAELASAYGHEGQFVTVLLTMARVLKRTARMNKRRTTPTTAQRLCALTEGSC